MDSPTQNSQTKPKILIVGIGSMYRKDDAAGLYTAQQLKNHNPRHTRIIECPDGGIGLIEEWKKFDTVIIIDAIRSGVHPGTIYRFDALHQKIPTKHFRCSSHTFDIVNTIEFAKVLNKCPYNLIVYGIEGRWFEVGTGLSEEVKKSVHEVTERILLEIMPISTIDIPFS